MAKEITKGKWNGIDNYQCPYCPHATTQGLQIMQAHVVSVHSEKLREEELKKMTADATKNTGGVLGGAGSDEESK